LRLRSGLTKHKTSSSLHLSNSPSLFKMATSSIVPSKESFVFGRQLVLTLLRSPPPRFSGSERFSHLLSHVPPPVLNTRHWRALPNTISIDVCRPKSLFPLRFFLHFSVISYPRTFSPSSAACGFFVGESQRGLLPPPLDD